MYELGKATCLQKNLRLCEPHIASSWRCGAPTLLTDEVTCPELRFNIGIVGGYDIDQS